SKRHQLSDSMRGQFSPWCRLWRCGDETGGHVGQTQHHGVAVGDEDIAHAVGARAGREQCKAAPEEGMGGIGDLDFRRVVYRWVVDRGIKMYGRLTKSIKRRSWKKWLQVHSLPDPYGNGSRQEL